MRIVQFIDDLSQVLIGHDLGDNTADVLDGDPLRMFPERPRRTGRVVPIRGRLTPIAPSNIFCIGMNYRSHVEEMGGTVPDFPVVFMKPNRAVTSPFMPIRLPKVQHEAGEVDQEAELAVVIGKDAKDVAVGDAFDYVLGYTCANDVSARWWQKHGGGGQFVRGKGSDTCCPVGPVITTHGDGEDEIADPQALSVSGSLDGELLQDGHTSDMIFSVAELISFLSQDTTLVKGSIILTGTPPGVGWAREPKKLMQSGMTSKIEIEKIGVLENSVV